MSGFDPAWLDLREAADAAARAPGPLARIADRFSGREEVAMADLGCGTGSLLRALAPLLPARQRWILIDGDPKVLAAARPRLAAWADSAEEQGGGLRLARQGCLIEVAFRQVDLATDPLPVEPGEADLIGASALFDLVSEDWLRRFADRLKLYGAPLYAALSYDGQMAWTPRHDDDARAQALFNSHQTRDKGTGAALGPAGASTLARFLAERGFNIALADSPWRLGPEDQALNRETLAGIALALREMQPAPWIDLWRDHPRATAMIGHQDLLAIP